MKRRQLQLKLGRLSGQVVVLAFALMFAACSESKSKLGGAVLSASEECAANADDCDVNATCTAHADSVSCECNVGFEGDGHTCKPTKSLIDECALGIARCQAHANCVDTQDSFVCACEDGYMEVDAVCKALGPSCDALKCDANAECREANGGAQCTCKQGFAGDGMHCSAIDRCSSLDCGDHGVCITTAQTASCSCDSGYAWDGKTCADVDECKSKLSDCAADAQCTNTPGRFTCACKAGFVGNGKQCLPSDPCAPDAAKCGAHSTCTGSMSGPVCVCDAGFEKVGEQCQEIHGCDGNPCDERGDAGATCQERTPATEYSCTCSAGFDSSTGAAPVCRNINECRNNPCDNNGDTSATCAELAPGSGYACACGAGFASSGGASPSCGNIDDCKDNPCDNNGDAAARCMEHTNAPGYSCTCTTPAFESTSGDKPSCRDVDECSGYPCARAGDSGATCKQNDPGPGYSCTCTANFTSQDGSCVPNSGCQDNPCDNNGDTGATCKANDPPPGYSCTCTSAFRASRGSCVPITDCQDNPCDADGDTSATCKENDPNPGHTCMCSSAFQPADGSCKAIVDCQDNPCDDEGDAAASCHENDPNPGYNCTCSPDYEAGSDAHPVCKRRDACALGGNANCVTSASGNTCTNAAAPSTGYTCDCKNAAYTPGADNTSCVTQADQCAQAETNDCKPQQSCVNLPDAVGTQGYGCTSLLGMWISNGIQLYDARVPIPLGSALTISGTGVDANAIVHALAVHPSTQQLWGVISSSNGGPTYLAALNITIDGSGKPTGVTAANVVSVSGDLRALAFDDSGTLWGVANSNLETNSLPRSSPLPALPSVLYTVNTSNGRLSFKRNLDAPPFPGETPTSTRCPNRSWKYAGASFQTDRETLVYATGTGKLYRFIGKRIEAINTSDMSVNDTDMKFASDVPGGEPRTIWAAIWNWPEPGRIGFTSPNAVYCDTNIGEYVFTSDTSGNIKRAFTESKTLLVRSLGLVAKDLGAPFRSMLPTAETCGAACNAGPYCSGLPECTKFGSASCGTGSDCSAIECRVNTTCGGGL